MTARRIAVVLGLAAVVVVVIVLAGGDSSSSYTVRAEFKDAAALRPNQQVKIAGVRVGTVEKLEVTPHDTALATMKLDSAGAPVGAGARAFVRPVNLIGEKYVDLDGGDTRRPQPSGTFIPLRRTGTPVELDDLIDTLDATTRTRLAILIDQNGRALLGRGGDLGATLRRLPPALDRAGSLVAALARDNQALGRLVEESDTVVGAIAGQRRALGRLVGSAGAALDAVASRQRQLGATVGEAPGAITQLRETLGRLDTTAVALRPAAVGLRASAPGLTATLRALPGFAAAARPTLGTARRVAPTLGRLGRRATPVVRRLRPVAERLDEFGQGLEPVSGTLDSGVGDLLGFLEGWARAIQTADGPSHMFRNQVNLSPELVTRLMSGYIDKSTARQNRTPTTRLTPAPASPKLPSVKLPKLPELQLPRLRDHVRDAVRKLNDVVGGGTRGDQPDSSQTLLDFLLGP